MAAGPGEQARHRHAAACTWTEKKAPMKSTPGTQVDHGPGELLRLTCVPGDTEDQVTAGNLAHIVSLVLLTPPDDEFLAAMASQRPLPGLRLSTRTLMNELALLAGGASLATYKAEYRRLFTAGDTAPCKPCESAWRRSIAPAGGTLRQHVLDAYREAGYGRADAPGAPADHLGVEMRFLAYLSAGIIEGTKSESTYSRFWENHVALWVPSFAECLRRSARIRFYRTLGQILLALTLPEAW
jgi:TorA maturation chaperone TorD